MESILISIKKLLGLDKEYTCFDNDVIIHINSVLATLTQLGVGPSEGFQITDSSATWNEFISGSTQLNAVKTYVYVKVRLIFDPPTSSGTITAFNELAKELEWRLNVAAETNYDD